MSNYHVETISSNLLIPADELESAYASIVAINADDENKSGRSLSPVDKPEGSTSVAASPAHWYKGMLWNYDEVFDKIDEVLITLGFDINYAVDGGLSIDGYSGEFGDIEHFLKALVTHVVPESGTIPFIAFIGEDGQQWRWNLYRGGFREEHPVWI